MKPKLLHRFFQAFDEFVDWVDAQGPSRAVQSQESLERLQRRRPSPEELEADAQVWKRLRDDFTNICHHRFEIDPSRFAEKIVILENLLLRYGRSIEADKHRAIAQIVAEAGDSPTPAHLQSIKALIDGWADKNSFLSQIEHPAWLALLLEDGWCDGSTIRFLDEPAPHYPESFILEKFSQILPMEVETACHQLARSGDPPKRAKRTDSTFAAAHYLDPACRRRSIRQPRRLFWLRLRPIESHQRFAPARRSLWLDHDPDRYNYKPDVA